MGFKIEVNQIIRTDNIPSDLKEGELYNFQKDGSRIFADSFPIWLVKKDWTPIAEIQMINQTKEAELISGKYKILHIYNSEEQSVIKDMFIRMYGWD